MRFIGYAIEYEEIISTNSGKKEKKTWQIMSQNTTQYDTNEIFHQYIWNQQKKIYKTQKTNELKPEKGVL